MVPPSLLHLKVSVDAVFLEQKCLLGFKIHLGTGLGQSRSTGVGAAWAGSLQMLFGSAWAGYGHLVLIWVQQGQLARAAADLHWGMGWGFAGPLKSCNLIFVRKLNSFIKGLDLSILHMGLRLVPLI